MPKEPQSPTPQNLKKYGRESGKKTQLFIAIIIALIVILTILSLILVGKPKILTSSIEKQLTPANSLPKKLLQYTDQQ